jgi:hypothetical protein
MRAVGTARKELSELADGGVVAGCGNLDSAVRMISHPAGQRKAPPLLSHEPAKPDTLHHSSDENVKFSHCLVALP